MATCLFTVPLLPGKPEAWRKYVQEMQGPRQEEWNKSRQKAGLTMEQVWLQRTPQGDMVVVRLEGKDPSRTMEYFMKSSDPFDQWFREGILVECHGLDLSRPLPPKNELMVDHQAQKAGQQVNKQQYQESKKR